MSTDRQAGARRASKTPSTALATLAVRPFRRYLLGQLTSNVGTWMQRAAQDLLVLHLTGNSGSAVGVITALQFLPQTLLGLTGGVLADRFPKRRLLLITQTAMAVQSLLLGLLTVTGAVNLWSLYALALALGTATAVDSPARNAFISELVSRDRVPTAVSLNSAQFNVARILGPAAAGLTVAALGTGPVFLINSVSYLAVLYGLITAPTGAPHEHSGPQHRGPRLTERSATSPQPRNCCSRSLSSPSSALRPQLPGHHLPRSHQGLPLRRSRLRLPLGRLRGRQPHRRRPHGPRGQPPTARRLVTATTVFGVLEAALGVMPGYGTFMALLIPTGYAAVTVTTTANALAQLHTEPHLRGRVLSVYFLVLLGGTPIGAPLVGVVSDAFGTRSTLILGGMLSASSALALSPLITKRQPLDSPRQAAGPIAAALPGTPSASTSGTAPSTRAAP